jgi:hypothetical protein
VSDEYDLGFVHKQDNGKGLKVTVNCFRGQWYVHLREYIHDLDDDIWFPTKKGIAVKAENVDTVADLFSKAGMLLTDIYYEELPIEKQLSLFDKEE